MLDRGSSMMLPQRLKFIIILYVQNLPIVSDPKKYRVVTMNIFGANNERILQNIDDTKMTVF